MWNRGGAMVSVAIAAPLAAGQISLQTIGTGAYGVSSDGTVVAGTVDTGTELQVFRWTQDDGIQLLGQGLALDISRDGTTLVGDSMSGAFRWRSETGFMSLGTFPGGQPPTAFDTSGDGSIVVGQGRSGTVFRGFRWTPASGLVVLGDLPGGFNYSDANSISADGNIIAGTSSSADGDRAVRWVGANPTPIDLGMPTGLTGFTESKQISGNGEVIVGVWGNGLENEAFRWTQAGGFELLGDLPGGLRDSVATAVNFDGSVIAGIGNPGDELLDEAVLWRSSGGPTSVRALLNDAGLDTTGWLNFTAITDMSDDGSVLVGIGTLFDGTTAGFRIVLPSPGAVSVLLGAGFLAGLPRRRRR